MGRDHAKGVKMPEFKWASNIKTTDALHFYEITRNFHLNGDWMPLLQGRDLGRIQFYEDSFKRYFHLNHRNT